MSYANAKRRLELAINTARRAQSINNPADDLIHAAEEFLRECDREFAELERKVKKEKRRARA